MGYTNGVVLNFSQRAKPATLLMAESFNGGFRAGRLNAHRSLSLEDAQEKIDAFR